MDQQENAERINDLLDKQIKEVYLSNEDIHNKRTLIRYFKSRKKNLKFN